jgi:hypothetical protein
MQVLTKHNVDSSALAQHPGWRRVAAGLAMVSIAWTVLPLSLLLAIALGCCTIFWGEEHPWLARLSMVTLSGYYITCAGLCITGMACCCRAPVESGGQHLAQAALGLLVVGLILFLFWQVYDPFRYWIPRGPYRYAVWLTILSADLATVLTLAAAALLWTLFLAAVAEHLGADDLHRQARRFAVVLAVWSGTVTAHVWFSYLHLGEHPVLLLIIVCMALGAFSLYPWMLLLMEMARVSVQNAVRRTPAD